MNTDEEKVRKKLDKLFKKVKKSRDPEELNELRWAIDDYIEQGYDVRYRIREYNELVQKFNSGK